MPGLSPPGRRRRWDWWTSGRPSLPRETAWPAPESFTAARPMRPASLTSSTTSARRPHVLLFLARDDGQTAGLRSANGHLPPRNGRRPGRTPSARPRGRRTPAPRPPRAAPRASAALASTSRDTGSGGIRVGVVTATGWPLPGMRPRARRPAAAHPSARTRAPPRTAAHPDAAFSGSTSARMDQGFPRKRSPRIARLRAEWFNRLPRRDLRIARVLSPR